jgi:hypothetical protein
MRLKFVFKELYLNEVVHTQNAKNHIQQLGFRAACKAKHETAVARNRFHAYGD